LSLDIYQLAACHATATPITIRFADVDMMRVVHHSAYIHYFEQIRFAFLHNLMKLDTATLLREAIACPVIECQAKYFRALRFGNEATGYGRVHVLRAAMFRFDYWVVRNRDPGALCASGSTTHCFVDEKLQLLLRAPRLFTDAFARTKVLFPGCFVDEGSAPADPAEGEMVCLPADEMVGRSTAS
jgi:acyl-CoA thioester hydrolase